MTAAVREFTTSETICDCIYFDPADRRVVEDKTREKLLWQVQAAGYTVIDGGSGEWVNDDAGRHTHDEDWEWWTYTCRAAAIPES